MNPDDPYPKPGGKPESAPAPATAPEEKPVTIDRRPVISVEAVTRVEGVSDPTVAELNRRMREMVDDALRQAALRSVSHPPVVLGPFMPGLEPGENEGTHREERPRTTGRENLPRRYDDPPELWPEGTPRSFPREGTIMQPIPNPHDPTWGRNAIRFQGSTIGIARSGSAQITIMDDRFEILAKGLFAALPREITQAAPVSHAHTRFNLVFRAAALASLMELTQEGKTPEAIISEFEALSTDGRAEALRAIARPPQFEVALMAARRQATLVEDGLPPPGGIKNLTRNAARIASDEGRALGARLALLALGVDPNSAEGRATMGTESEGPEDEGWSFWSADDEGAPE